MKIKEMNVMHEMQLKEFLRMIHSLWCALLRFISHSSFRNHILERDSIKTYMMMPSWITFQSLNFNATSSR